MKDILQRLSCHYTTLNPEYMLQWQAENQGVPAPSQKIPDDLVDELIRRRYFNQALYCAHQL
jgi:metallopeptidase MepB